MIHLTVKDLLTATDNFNERHVIGSGGTSTVYKGLLPSYPFIIAVKKSKDEEDGRQRLLKEAGIMSIVHVILFEESQAGVHFCERTFLECFKNDAITNETFFRNLHKCCTYYFIHSG